MTVKLEVITDYLYREVKWWEEVKRKEGARRTNTATESLNVKAGREANRLRRICGSRKEVCL